MYERAHNPSLYRQPAALRQPLPQQQRLYRTSMGDDGRIERTPVWKRLPAHLASFAPTVPPRVPRVAWHPTTGNESYGLANGRGCDSPDWDASPPSRRGARRPPRPPRAAPAAGSGMDRTEGDAGTARSRHEYLVR